MPHAATHLFFFFGLFLTSLFVSKAPLPDSAFLSCNIPDANHLGVGVVEHPNVVDPPLPPPDSQPTLSRAVGVGLTGILFAAVVWFSWALLKGNAPNTVRDHLAHRAGRSEAVSQIGREEDVPHQCSSDYIKGRQPRQRISAAVVSVDGPTYCAPPIPIRQGIYVPTLLSEEPEGLDNSPPVVPRRPVPSRKNGYTSSPLEASLRGTMWWSILVVAVNYGGLVDPENDERFWRKIFADDNLTRRRVSFKSITGGNATLKNIEMEFCLLYVAAVARGISRPNILVYLTGEGDGTNKMHLSHNTFICKDVIQGWVQELHQNWNIQPVTVLFDVCRQDATPGLPNEQMGLNEKFRVIYTCSPGQGALALPFRCLDVPVPFSVLSLAFVMASYNLRYPAKGTSKGTDDMLSLTESQTFKKSLEDYLAQLCNLGSLRARIRLPLQRPDWGQSGSVDLNPILKLSAMLSEADMVHKIHNHITNNKHFLKANVLSNTELQAYSVVHDSTTQHYRGGSQCVISTKS